MTVQQKSRALRSSAAACVLTVVLLLTVVKIQSPYQMLLADRFLPGAGWVEIAVLACYSGWLVHKLSLSKDTSKIRLRIWLAFSIVFFTQLIIGVLGIDKLLMTGTLHVPVPAVVIAGPVFRGERFFMPILFLATIVFVGPGWCSHLCYIGAWDGLAAATKKRAGRVSSRWIWIRLVIFALTPSVALLLRFSGVSGRVAAYVAIFFGVVSIASMALLSRRRGSMIHCTVICPLGLASNVLGKVSPFRIRISGACNDCGRCISRCRYGALDTKKIKQRRPGYTCTLCGDCLGVCGENALGYRFIRLSPEKAQAVFRILIVSLHAVFLGVARI